MKIFRQSIIIFGLYLIGDFLSKSLHLTIPGNILGMILLFLLLLTNVIKLEKVEAVSNFFLDHLAFFFIPTSVGLMTSFGALKGSILKILFLCIVTTFLVMGVTAVTINLICKIKKNK